MTKPDPDKPPEFESQKWLIIILLALVLYVLFSPT